MAAPNGPSCAHNQNGNSHRLVQASSSKETSKTAPSPTATLGAPAGNLPWHAKLWPGSVSVFFLRLLPPLEPSLGATELRSKSPDFLLLGRGPRKGETAIAKLLVSTAMVQDKTEKTDKRTWPDATAHHPPPARHHQTAPCSFRRLCMEGVERDAAHRFGPKLWENVLLLSAKLGFSRCQPGVVTPPAPRLAASTR